MWHEAFCDQLRKYQDEGKMPDLHEAFKNSGEKAGIEIWRIENFTPVPVPQKQHGNFYSGDSYIVLKTTQTKSRLAHDIHFWLGESTSADEAGSAALWSINLDDQQFHGAAVQHREVQGHEGKDFLDLFPDGISYLDGGHASGFSHVTTNAGAEKKLFQIKGKRNVRVRQVEAKSSSLNRGDCFVLDVNHTIFLYVGEKASKMERMKAITVANRIRDLNHNGRGNVEIIDPYSSDDDFQAFFTALGSGDKDSIADESSGGSDEEFDAEAKEACLSEVTDSGGKMSVTALPKPPQQDQLKTEECYILDAGKSGIFVWVGRKSNENEKAEALSRAQQYLKSQNLPDWVHVSKIPEGLEPQAFRQHFPSWA